MADLHEKLPALVVREDGTVLRLRKLPLRIRLLHRIEDYIDDIDWRHVAFKTLAYTYLAFILFIAWQILPIAGHWDRPGDADKVPINYQSFAR
jgi:hypothetical protein